MNYNILWSIIRFTMFKEYIVVAVSCIAVGVILTFVLLGITVRMGININENLWVLAIPAVISLFLNIILLELYRKFWKK
ncbi:hypothetical protein ACFLYQ_07925 [Chloroflexota bacterium]